MSLPEDIKKYIEEHKIELYHDEIDSIAEFLIPNISGRVFFDVGAKIGVWSVIASLCGASEVHIFEPNRRHLATAVVNTYNTRSDPEFRIYACSEVMWSSRGTVYYDNWRADSRNEKNRNAETLDWYSKDIPEIGFIKIDTENAELEILKGAQGLLEQKRPLLMVEDHSNHVEEMRGMFKDMYYEPFPTREWANHRHIYLKDIRLAQ